MAGFGGANRRGRLGTATDLVMDMDGGDKYNTVLDGTSGNEDNNTVLDRTCSEDKSNFVLDGTSRNRRGSWVGIRVGSTTSVYQSMSHSSCSSSNKTPTGADFMAGSHTW